MGDPVGYSVPFLTSQSRSAHPFFLGPRFQNRRSKNIWVDEQLRIRRRPGLVDIADVPFSGSIDSMFEYSYRSRASTEARSLVGAANGNLSGVAGVDVLTDRILGQLLAGAFPTLGQSRLRLHGTVTRLSGVSVRFKHRETCNVLRHSDGVFLALATMIVDNLDYVVPDGDIIIAGVDLTTPTAAVTNLRIVGLTSGATIAFTARTPQTPIRRVWATRPETGSAPATTTNQQWQEGAVTTFAQFGNLLLFTDDSFLFPVRIWSGAFSQASFLTQAPRAKYIATHQGRVWLAGLERNGAEIVASGVLDPYAWEETGLADSPVRFFIEQDDRDSISAISQSYRGDLYVWKNRSMHRISGIISGDVPPQFTTITRSIGCASHRTVQHVGNDVLWMSERGVHALSVTEKFGDVESTYLSFPISDVFEELNTAALRKAQAVFHPRLGLYILGLAMRDSEIPNLIVVWSTVSQRWMTWDIGPFNSIAMGPPVAGEVESLFVNRPGFFTVGGSPQPVQGIMSILDFRLEEDQSRQVLTDLSAAPIACVLAPGTLFVEDELRYQTKQAQRLQVYHSSPGEFESDVIFAWDGGKEVRRKLQINPQHDKVFGTGWAFGADELGNGLRSKDDTTASSVPLVGRGHTMEFRIEDSNPGRLPYLHSDIEYQVGQKDYTSQPRGKL